MCVKFYDQPLDPAIRSDDINPFVDEALTPYQQRSLDNAATIIQSSIGQWEYDFIRKVNHHSTPILELGKAAFQGGFHVRMAFIRQDLIRSET